MRNVSFILLFEFQRLFHYECSIFDRRKTYEIDREIDQLIKKLVDNNKAFQKIIYPRFNYLNELSRRQNGVWTS